MSKIDRFLALRVRKMEGEGGGGGSGSPKQQLRLLGVNLTGFMCVK